MVTLTRTPAQVYVAGETVIKQRVITLDNEIIEGIEDVEDRATALEATAGTPGLQYNTKALMDADLAHVAGTVAFVNFDGAQANNGKYIKLGGSGSGSWSQVDDQVDFRIRQFAEIRPVNFFPFADGIAGTNTDWLRRFVREIAVYGLERGDSQPYIKRVELSNAGGGVARITIADFTTGLEIAKEVSLLNFGAQPTHWKLRDFDVDASNVLVCMTFDWGEAVNITYDFTPAESEIHQLATFGLHDCDSYLDDDMVHEQLLIGTGLDYATLDAAIDGLTDFDVTGYGVTCGRSHFGHRIELLLTTAPLANSRIDANGVVYDYVFPIAVAKPIPDFVQIRGAGKFKHAIYGTGTTADAILEWHKSSKLIDLTVYAQARTGYCIHSDDVGNESRANDGTTPGNRRVLKVAKNVELIGAPLATTNMLGMGISDSEHVRLVNLTGGGDAQPYPGVLVSCHGTGITSLSKRPATLELIGCRNWDGNPYGVQLISLGSGNQLNLIMTDSPMGVAHALATGNVKQFAEQAFEWSEGGNVPFVLRTASLGLWVLAAPAGQAVTGTAKPFLFGTPGLDDLNRGSLNVTAGYDYPPGLFVNTSLGARIGNAPGWTLTIGGKTHTFNYNATAMTNAAIVTAINANITSPHSVFLVDIQKQVYIPGQMRRMNNDSGATIAAGKIVRRVGANGIELADGLGVVFGVVVRDILNGGTGYVFDGKPLPSQYIPGAEAQDGEFGVAAGVLSFADPDKVGFVDADGTLVHFYGASTITVPTADTPWALISSWTHSGDVANVDFTGLGGYSELMVLIRGVTLSVSGIRNLLVSVNNGSTFYSTSGDYVTVAATGSETNEANIPSHGTSATAARSGLVFLRGSNLATGPKYIQAPWATLSDHLFLASAAAINAVRIVGSGGGNLQAGSIYVFGKA